VNFGCEQTQQVKTPEVFFGANARDIQPRSEWVQTDNAKGQDQQVIYDRNGGNNVRGVLAQGSITGLDKQLFNCPGVAGGVGRAMPTGMRLSRGRPPKVRAAIGVPDVRRIGFRSGRPKIP
jgi:hypothetical protein